MSDDPFDSLVHQARLADEIESHVKQESLENWRPLPYEPFYCDYHPCPHRWFKHHNEPRPPRKNIKQRELSERGVWLAHPLVRRLLWLWICHANTLSAERRARLKAILISYGYTEEELERYILEEEVRKKKREGGVGSDEEGERDEVKNKRKKVKDANTFGKGKAGKPGKGWPHAIGQHLFQWLWSTLMSPPDEVFLSRAREYFDVQAELLLDICTEAIGKPIAHDATSCPIEQTIAIACLNLVVCIAKSVVAPAQEIPEKDIDKLLKLKGNMPKPVKETKMKPKKKRKNKQKDVLPKELEKNSHAESLEVNNNIINEGWTETTLPLSLVRQLSVTIDPIERFKKNLIWYNPREPEFIYNGPRLFPPELKITECEEILWCIQSFTVPEEKIIPEPIPTYFESSRPTVYSYSNNDKDEENPQPWYIMSDESYYEPGPRISDIAPIVEVTDMFFHMMAKMMKIPDLSMTALLEMMRQQADAANSVVEEVTPEDMVLDNKRTIILERIYVDFFGFGFRDYNDQTWDIMYSLCHRTAVMIRHIYRYTAHTLWTLQGRDKFKLQRKQSFEIPPDDPAMLEAWNEWLEWLKKIITSAKEWAIWLEACENELTVLATKMKPKPFNKWVNKARGEAQEMYDMLDEIHEAADYYTQNIDSMEQVNNRPVQDGYIYEKRYPDLSRMSGVTNETFQTSRSRGTTKNSTKYLPQ